MKYVSDPELEKEILAIFCQLLPVSEAMQITFGLCNEINPIATLWIMPDKHLLHINTSTRNLLKSSDGKKLLHAAIAHEIGHIKDAQETGLDFEKTTDLYIAKELRADEIAISLLEKIYQNPKEIMLKQIDFALNATLNCGFALQEEIKLAKLFANARKQAIKLD